MLNIEKTLELVTSMGPLHLKVFSTIMPILTKKYNVRMADFDVNKSIFFYGIDSIKIIDIHGELEKTLKCTIPTVAFFEANTFIDMIDDIVKSITGERPSQEVTDNAAMLREEITTHTSRLSQRYSTARETLANSGRRYGGCFLTGASGFVGGYLLKELLDATDDVVYCLVRAKDEPAGMQRILTNAKKYNIKFPPGAADRIKPVIGDASKPCFGLSDNVYQQLAETLDSLYHCAAVDNFYLPYSVLKNTNVFGTTEIAAFAMTRKIKPLYYISSCAANLINNDLSDFSVVGLVNGYAQTKFVAEKIIQNLIAQGFPAMNFRLGYLYSLRLEQIDSHASFEQMLAAVSKAYDNLDESVLGDEDAFENFLAAIPKIGAVPALNAVFDLMPVEYAAKSIVATSLQGAAADKADYTFYNPYPLQWSDLVAYFKRHYRRMEIVPLDVFVERFQDYVRASEKKSIKLLKSVVSPELESQLNRMFAGIDTDRVDAFERWCPPCDRRFTEHYIDFAING